jgi:hypothetical protein
MSSMPTRKAARFVWLRSRWTRALSFQLRLSKSGPLQEL